jgi:hypothetical protein
MPHLVVIGDLIASRTITGRARFQDNLRRALADISAARGDALASPYTVTLGDEFQAVYRSARGVFADLCRVRLACEPARVRLSLAVGKLTTAINPTQAIGMDGPAFHVARAGIDTLKKSGVDFALAGPAPGEPAQRELLIDLLSAFTQTWKPSRWAILAGLLENRPVAELARETHLTEAAVYKNIRHARLEAFAALLTRTECVLMAPAGAKHP